MEFLAWLDWVEQTGLSVWLRESTSLFAFPLVIAVHSIGMAFIVGGNVAIDLRILGVAPDIPLAPMERFFPVMWLGFWLNAISGVGLSIAHPELYRNWLLYTKFGCIVLAVVSLWLLRKEVFHDPSLDEKSMSMRGKLLAVATLVFWAGAITAGRMTAYFGIPLG